jgi:hypothetical protein
VVVLPFVRRRQGSQSPISQFVIYLFDFHCCVIKTRFTQFDATPRIYLSALMAMHLSLGGEAVVQTVRKEIYQ